MKKYLDEKPYYLGLSYCYGIGPMRYKKLLEVFGDLKIAYHAKQEELVPIFGYKITTDFCRFRSNFDLEKKLLELEKKEISLISQVDPQYPPQLLELTDAPICLYIKGKIDLYDWKNMMLLAVVGTRQPTVYGSQLAKKFAFELAQAGVTVISGMALGIDALAHEGALQAKGKTIAVLGCGVDMVYPPSNRWIYEKILKNNGLVISEFPPGHLVMKGLFVARNRIISGISAGVLVIEGTKDSGALITARYAAEQGREVFAVPGPISSSLSAAPNSLLKQGAALVSETQDIMNGFGMRMISKKKKSYVNQNLTNTENVIIKLLEKEALLIDEIIIKTQFDALIISQQLSNLEIKGLVEKARDGKYQIK